MKKDDATLSPSSEATVRKYADLLLRKASAYGRFPTPAQDLVRAAELEIARESALAGIGLDGLYRRLPNALKLAPDKIKKAAAKLLGLLDRGDRMIHLAPDAYPKRKLYVTIHEIGHDFLPHQRKTYGILEDSDAELDHDTSDLFEREANCFASEVLFQLDGFTKEAAEFTLGIKVPVELSKRYGPSIYATARRYVSTHRNPCALVVYDPATPLAEGGHVLEFRRSITSTTFAAQFGSPAWPQRCGPESFFFRNRPKNKFALPRSLSVRDVNGDDQLCMVESFNSTYQILFLVYPAPTPIRVAS